PAVAWIMVNYGWQSAFYASALAGILIAVLWGWYARDLPAQHASVNEAELNYIRSSLTPVPTREDMISPHASQGKGPGEAESVPWAAFIQTPSVWWLVLAYTCLGYVAYVYMTWFYLYLVNERGFDVLRG